MMGGNGEKEETYIQITAWGSFEREVLRRNLRRWALDSGEKVYRRDSEDCRIISLGLWRGCGVVDHGGRIARMRREEERRQGLIDGFVREVMVNKVVSCTCMIPVTKLSTFLVLDVGLKLARV